MKKLLEDASLTTRSCFTKPAVQLSLIDIDTEILTLSALSFLGASLLSVPFMRQDSCLIKKTLTQETYDRLFQLGAGNNDDENDERPSTPFLTGKFD